MDNPKRKLNVLPAKPIDEDEAALGRFPSWLHRPMPKGNELWDTKEAVRGQRLYTVCEEAKCPNLLECWSQKTATFLVMGKACTRACGFCDIAHTKTPPGLEEDEPERLADSVEKLGLKHVVITMVARDDLEDGGALQLKRIVHAVRRKNPSTTVELLTSDLKGNKESLDIICASSPEIFNHNIETTRRLTPRVRHVATYERTLDVLSYVAEKLPQGYIKSGLMVGLGESDEEVLETLQDLKNAGCQIVTIGQYLQASHNKLRVKAFIPPATFDYYRQEGEKMGLKAVYSGPFVRSSYNAGLVFEKLGRKIVIDSL